MTGESSGNNNWAFLRHSEANSSVAAGIAGVPTLENDETMGENLFRNNDITVQQLSCNSYFWAILLSIIIFIIYYYLSE